MAPERERPTRRQAKEGRTAQQAADRLEREADRMERRSDKVGAEIDQARSDWRRKRASREVPVGTPPESQQGAPEEASHPVTDQEEGEAEEDEDRPA